MTDTRYTFISVVRMGAAKAIAETDTFDVSTKGRASFTAAFSVVGNTTNTPVSKSVRLHGPSDVLALDPRQVIRTEPKALTPNYEPNFFAAVEFDRPDFPWLMTPARETPLQAGATNPQTASARLRPWIVLVAVRQQPGVTLTMPQGSTLPVLEITGPALVAEELQDLSDSWAWAHAQTLGAIDEAETALKDIPEHNCSRLLCPHRLKPLSSYIACVVPAFLLGKLTGLGLPVTDADEAKLEPAWQQSDASVKLPVYFHFEFSTGPNGDFEALAELLAPHSLTASDVTIPFDIKHTNDSRLPTDSDDILLDGALTAGEPPEFDDLAYQTALAGIVSQAEPTLDPSAADPVIAPPLYGRWHAAKQSVAPGDGWLADLNLDPRRRVAAALGTRVVQEHQEQLMESAWDQLGEVQKVNQALRRAQLAREAMKAAYSRTLAKLSPDSDGRFNLVSPVLRRVFDAGSTVASTFGGSRVPDGLVSPAFRRLVRPRGALGARLFGRITSQGPLPSLIGSISAAAFNVVPGKVGTGQVDGNATGPNDTLPVFAHPGTVLPALTAGITLSDPSVNVSAFRTSAVSFQQFFSGPSGPASVFLPSSRPALPGGLGTLLGNSVHPATALTQRVLARLARGGGTFTSLGPDPLEPVMGAPEFTQPMYAPLRDLSPDYLLPGVSRIPPNTVTLLDTNRAFIEAYLAGLNHEMARELLWRGYPTDQRGTYFAQFWDPSCRVPEATNDLERARRKDIVPMHTWPRTSRLGDHEPNDPGRTPGNQVVLVIRGELLRRYPNTIIYAAPLVTGSSSQLDESNEELPIFRGTLPPDITFLGFNLTDADVRNRQLYFVLQEQPSEPRFGLNEAPPEPIDPSQVLEFWQDLSWGHFGADAKFVKAGTLPNAGSLPSSPAWGVNSAHFAQITLQTPVRIAIFGPDILPSV
jgi:hypothetical protein